MASACLFSSLSFNISEIKNVVKNLPRLHSRFFSLCRKQNRMPNPFNNETGKLIIKEIDFVDEKVCSYNRTGGIYFSHFCKINVGSSDSQGKKKTPKRNTKRKPAVNKTKENPLSVVKSRIASVCIAYTIEKWTIYAPD